jgi:hypothetical protein
MRKSFDIGICTFSYGGNGGISSEVPDIREWMVPLAANIAQNPIVGDLKIWNLSDTPITMTRNRSVMQAREYGLDILIMVDSDMKPDLGDEPFFDSSFDFLVNHYDKGPVCIGAPYCGPPPDECVYVFRWQNQESGNANPDFQLEAYDRHTASKLAGIQECAALPTGLIMYDMRCFDITEPRSKDDNSWFYYEWLDKYATRKASTEDVTMTRDLSIAGTRVLGYNPVLCNWNAWAGHWKPKCVGPPVMLDAKEIGRKISEDWLCDSNLRQIDLRQEGIEKLLSNGNSS